MKTLADFKRALVLGSTWQTTYVGVGPRCGQVNIRKVQLVQKNGVQFEPLPESKSGSWLYFTKAKDYDFKDGKVIAKFADGTPFAIYEPLVLELNPAMVPVVDYTCCEVEIDHGN